ncbi:hypothetical protein GGI11_003792, partial [Coemansia sp. RSA 2049]
EGVHTYAMPAAAEENWRAYVQRQFGIELDTIGLKHQPAGVAPAATSPKPDARDLDPAKEPSSSSSTSS